MENTNNKSIQDLAEEAGFDEFNTVSSWGSDEIEEFANKVIAKYQKDLALYKKALFLSVHRTIKPCPALPCSTCTGWEEQGVETINEACTRGKIDHFLAMALKEFEENK